MTMVCYQFLNRTMPHKIDFMTDLDRAIPLIPWSFVIYQSHYLMLLAAAILVSARDFTKLLVAALGANCLCYIGFVFATSHYPRPDPATIDAFWSPAYAWMYGADPPGNTFPSIHVATTTIIALIMRKQKGGNLWLLWGLLINISTMTVKQHYIADVISGMILAGALYVLLYRPNPNDPQP